MRALKGKQPLYPGVDVVKNDQKMVIVGPGGRYDLDRKEIRLVRDENLTGEGS